MFISNLEFMTGKKVIKHLGLVQDSSVRAKHAGKDIMSGIKNQGKRIKIINQTTL